MKYLTMCICITYINSMLLFEVHSTFPIIEKFSKLNNEVHISTLLKNKSKYELMIYEKKEDKLYLSDSDDDCKCNKKQKLDNSEHLYDHKFTLQITTDVENIEFEENESEGTWRRIKIIPFKTKFDNNEEKNNTNNAQYDITDDIYDNIKMPDRLCDLQIGDIVEISYMPYSQKYLDYDIYQSFIGKILYIDEEHDDALLYHDIYNRKTKKYDRVVLSLDRPGCSYFGDSKGYDYMIKKIN